MMDKSNTRLQKERHIVVDPLSLKRPSFRQTHFETTSPPKGIPTSDNTRLHPPPPVPLQPSKHKFLRSTMPSSANSSPKSQELPSEVSNLTHKNHHHLQRIRSMSLSSSQGKKTHATLDEFELRLSDLDDNRHKKSVNKNEAIIKDGPKGSKRMENDDGFIKCCALGMCLPVPGFVKAKEVKARKGGTEMDQYSVNNPVMSSTFSSENFQLDYSGVTQGRIAPENNEDDSISSYFELPSNML